LLQLTHLAVSSQQLAMLTSDLRRRGSLRWHRAGVACLLLVSIVVAGIAVDWILWSGRDAGMRQAISTAGGTLTSLFDWPIGKEYYMALDTVPTHEQLKTLEALNHPPHRSVVSVMIRTCEADEADMRRISAALHSCHVFQVCDGEIVSPDDRDW
jgi:hypothetical protein